MCHEVCGTAEDQSGAVAGSYHSEPGVNVGRLVAQMAIVQLPVSRLELVLQSCDFGE